MLEIRTLLRRTLALLPAGERRRWLALVPLVAAAATVEAASALLVVAVVAALARVPATRLAAPFADASPILLAALLAAALALRGALLAVVETRQARVASEASAALGRDLLARYLAAPWSFHRRRNAVETLRALAITVEGVFLDVLGPLLRLLGELLVVAALLFVLAIAAPLPTLAVLAVVGALAALVLAATRGAARRVGGEHAELRARTVAQLQQLLAALKELKVAGREGALLARVAATQHRLADARRRATLLATLPRLAVETLFGVAVLLVALALVRGGDAAGVPLLGLFAYAGFRVVPAVNRVVLHVQTLRHGAALLDELERERAALAALPAEPLDARASDAAAEPAIPFRRALELAGVGFRYPGDERWALADVDLVVRRGEALAVVGASGAGKSTLVDLVLGLLPPSRGEIRVDGVPIAAAPRAWRRRIGYVPQEVLVLDDSLRRNLAPGVDDAALDPARLAAAVRLAGLDTVVAALPHGLDTVVGEGGVRLSGGERQRVAIARALYGEPELLVFDEPSSALDARTEAELARAIAALRGDHTILLVAHRRALVEACDRVVVLDRGRVAAVGTPAELSAPALATASSAAAAPEAGERGGEA